MKKTSQLLLTILLIILSFQGVNAQCELPATDLVVEAYDCNTDGGFMVDMYFNYQGTTDSFMVYVNGEDYGSYRYDELFITLGPFYGDGETTYGFSIVDVDNFCFAYIELDPIDCFSDNDCAITNVNILETNCSGSSNGTYNFTIDLETQFPDNDFFDVFANGDFLGFYSLVDLPLTVENFSSSGNTSDVITICINDNPDCCYSLAIEAPDCLNSECQITDLIAEPQGCDDNGMFYIDILFNHQNMPSDSFFVIFDGNYEQFEYPSTPNTGVTVGPFLGNGNSSLEFIIIDSQGDCQNEVAIDPVNCAPFSCSIENPVYEISDCSPDGLIDVTIAFENDPNPSGLYDLIVYSGGSVFGSFDSIELPFTIPGYPNDNDGYLALCSTNDPNCCADLYFEVPDCDPNDCEINNLIVEAHECDANGEFLVDLNFTPENMPSDSFIVVGNGNNYGTFAYADLWITIGPIQSEPNTELEFIVFDSENDGCQAFTGLDPIDCNSTDCQFTNLIVEPYECVNGEFLVDLDFNAQNTTSDSFVVVGNGNNYGTFAYADLGVTFGPIENIPNTVLEFIVYDSENDGCLAEAVFEPINCTDNDCEISELIVEAHECDADGFFLVDMNFIPQNMPSDSFVLVVNGNEYATYPYSDLWITFGPFEGDENMAYEFIVYDAQNDGCSASTGLDPIECDFTECPISDLTTDVLGCNPDGSFNMILNFNAQDAATETFAIFVNEEFLQFGNINDLPLTVENVPSSGEDFELIQVCQNAPMECCNSIDIEAPNCDADGCIVFEDLQIGTSYGAPDYGNDDVIFIENGVPVKMQEYDMNGSSIFGTVHVLDNNAAIYDYPNLDNNILYPLQANLEFNFLQLEDAVVRIEFDYWNEEGGITIGANDAPLVVADLLIDIDGMEIAPGVTITILPDDNDDRLGRAIIEGFVGLLTIGGNDGLILDNICYDLATLGDCWPGDTDLSNLTSNFDLLNLGLAYGSEGTPRENANLGWIAQPSEDWTQSFSNGVNFKHADTNGDGVINANDKFAIDENYGLTHGPVEPYIAPIANPNDPNLFIVMPPPSDISVGAFQAEIHLGTADISIDDIYGLAFTLQFNDQIFDPSSMEIIFENGFLNNNGGDDLLTMQHREDGTIAAAVTRINQASASGSGKIGTINGIIDDLTGYASIDLGILDVKAVRSNETVLPLHTPTNYLELSTTSTDDLLAKNILIYPNPANDLIFIKNKNLTEIRQFRLVNILGQEVLQQYTSESDFIEINVAKLPQGIYFLEVEGEDFRVSRKIEITH